ncbi:MAG: DUF2341 domain-containing protein [bacterium]|nr:DUF2341 domain-containing protein [bacterium]
MKTDISRNTFDSRNRYSGVRQQQGRILTDSDWNEQLDTSTYLRQTANRDSLGPTGAPVANPGFAITAAVDPENGGASTLAIGAGRLYVEGLLCENFAERLFREQADLPGATLPDSDGDYLVYMEARSRAVTALEDSGIREPALGGVETSSREQTITQIKLAPLAPPASGEYSARSRPPEWDALINAPRGRLTARTVADGVPANPCDLAARGGYTGTDNRLYRVEIHRGGTPGVATYKWSRDNASLAVEWLSQPSPDTLQIRARGRDREQSFLPGQWIEINDEGLEFENRPGTLARIAQVDDQSITIDPDSLIHFDSGVTALDIDDFSRGVRRIRRWDMVGAVGEPGVPAGPGEIWIAIENGLEVAFDADNTRVYTGGDYWMIPARAVSRNIEWPCDPETQTPLAITSPAAPRFARLAFVQRSAGIWSVTGDARRILPALSDANLTLAGGDGQALFPNARLAEALAVRFSNGGVPAPGARIQFSVSGGAGTLEATDDATNTGMSVEVLTDAQGLASVYWDTGADRDSQQASAVFIDDRPDSPTIGQALESTRIFFRAHKTLATATEHSPQAMPDPDGADLMAGVDTVAQALDRLGETKVNRAGDVITGDLEIQGNFTVRGDVIARDTDHMPGDVLLGDQDEDTITIHGTLASEHTSDALVINDGVQINAPNADESPLAVNATIQGFAGRLYRTAITVDNAANSSTLSNYQIALTVDTAALIAAGKLRTDAGDLLFTDSDGSTTIPHWIESGANSATTRVWVRVPELPGATTHTIYMYYGNPASVTPTAPESVFVRSIGGVLSAYNFDEGTGAMIADLSGQGNDGVTVGAGAGGDPAWTSGRFDGALNFDGDNQYASLPAFSAPTQLNDFTISVWAKFATGLPDGRYYLLDFRGDGSSAEDSFAMILDYVGGQAEVHHYLAYIGLSVRTEYQTPISDPGGIWTQFVLLRRGSSLEAYVNGTRIADNFRTGNPNVPPRLDPVSLANPKRLASGSTGAFFQGDLDDVRLYNRALDAAEISDIAANRSYVSPALPGDELLRRYAVSDPTAAAGVEETLTANQGSVLYVQSGSGNVGVGTDNPSEKLSVAGIIETTSGGIKFPDGTIQTTAGGGSGLISGGANLPLGTIIAWHRDLDGSIPALPDGWAECDGSPVNDPDSPLFGTDLPNLNDPLQGWNSQGSFLRGGTTSGNFENDQMQGHLHGVYPHAGTHDDANYPITTAGAGGEDTVTTRVSSSITSRPRNDGTHGNPRYGSETRPANMSVVWIIRIKDVGGGAGGLWSNATGGINFDEGNVGIDNNSPQAKLHVGGTPGVDGILFPDGSLQTTAGGGGQQPVGTIIAWHKSLTGTPALPDGWVECNGQVLNDPLSPYNGDTIPDLNNSQDARYSKGSFLRGDLTSGDFEADQLQTHRHFWTSENGLDSQILWIARQEIVGEPANSVSFSQAPGWNARNTIIGEAHNANVGSETRPTNMSVVWIMKVRDTAQINAGGYARMLDRKSPGTPGGNPPAGVYTRRDLNELETNIAGISLTNNQFVLPAGTYQVHATLPAHRADRNRAKLVNVSDGVDVLFSASANANNSTSVSNETTIQGIFTSLAEKTYEFQHYVTTSGEGTIFGVETNSGDDEVYTQVSLLKLTAPGLPPRPQEIGFAAQGFNHVSSGAAVVLSYSNVYTNAGDAFDGTTFTAPIAGLYSFSVTFTEGRAGNYVELALRINGVSTQIVVASLDSATHETAALTTTYELAAGDTVDTQVFSGSGAERALDPYSFSGHKI